MESDLTARVQALVAEALQVPPDQIMPNLAFGGLPQWDSMGHMGIMLLLEERFGIPIDADLIGSLTSIPAICETIQKSGEKS